MQFFCVKSVKLFIKCNVLLNIFNVGSHPELEKLVSVLDESPSTQEEIVSQNDVLSKSSVNSESCLITNTGLQKNSEIDKTKDCSKTFPEEQQMLDFNLDDDCNDIVSPSQEEIEKCLHSAKESVLLDEGKDRCLWFYRGFNWTKYINDRKKHSWEIAGPRNFTSVSAFWTLKEPRFGISLDSFKRRI